MVSMPEDPWVASGAWDEREAGRRHRRSKLMACGITRDNNPRGVFWDTVRGESSVTYLGRL